MMNSQHSIIMQYAALCVMHMEYMGTIIRNQVIVCAAIGRLSSMTHAAAGQFSRLKLPQDQALTHDIGTGFKCVSCAALAAAATALPLLPTHQQAAITALPSQATLQNKH